jgi:putative phosphoribosyl transferase
MKPFTNRLDAGRQLTKQLKAYINQPDLIILGLPRGGVPIAYEVAKALHAPLDVLIIRKLGVPNQKEFAMGAISGHTHYLNQDLINTLNISPDAIQKIIHLEQAELQRREALYRANLPPLDVSNKTIILVDDGIATGATVHAAIQTLRIQKPKQIILAVPVAAASSCSALKPLVDNLICLQKPTDLQAVGQWYEDFSETTDTEVLNLLYNA